ncbi:MAG TPA: hypothetical protein IGS53_24200 [Leptolyngbyaceae cyanobacterium M33_DOE_097]|uniref:Phasin family protein n=1 Tax=Oscillatoriales cyanobacterium SpSt-418 TaxID=2282169 RepID=A0A7C3KH45_9CYAN|nr:hypothetical protein [Leptolyngbyaceae cyanobacterium M33_DOE_097]
MNTEEILQTAQKGFHITLGATATLIESLQDAQKREENAAKLRQDWQTLSEELALKGRTTEQEARVFVDSIMNRQSQSSSTSPNTSSTASGPAAPPEVQQDIQSLTEQLASLRQELERLRNERSSN